MKHENLNKMVLKFIWRKSISNQATMMGSLKVEQTIIKYYKYVTIILTRTVHLTNSCGRKGNNFISLLCLF